jgi:hypothetical protein
MQCPYAILSSVALKLYFLICMLLTMQIWTHWQVFEVVTSHKQTQWEIWNLFQIKHISALMNQWFLNLVVTGANNIFGESPFDLAVSFGVVRYVWATFAGFSHIRVKIQILNMRNTVSVHQLSFSLVRHLQRHTLDNTIFYLITFSPVLHFLINSVQSDIRQEVQWERVALTKLRWNQM